MAKRRTKRTGIDDGPPLSVNHRTVEVPTFVLRADRRIDILALVTLQGLAEEAGKKNLVAEIGEKVREFELYQDAPGVE
jgi:hypothetical protein